MIKLGHLAKNTYIKNGERKLNCYLVNIPKRVVFHSGIKDTDELKVYTKDGKIIIEKA